MYAETPLPLEIKMTKKITFLKYKETCLYIYIMPCCFNVGFDSSGIYLSEMRGTVIAFGSGMVGFVEAVQRTTRRSS